MIQSLNIVNSFKNIFKKIYAQKIFLHVNDSACRILMSKNTLMKNIFVGHFLLKTISCIHFLEPQCLPLGP